MINKNYKEAVFICNSCVIDLEDFSTFPVFLLGVNVCVCASCLALPRLAFQLFAGQPTEAMLLLNK